MEVVRTGESAVRRLVRWHHDGRPKLTPVASWTDREVGGLPILCPSQSTVDGSVVLGHITPGDSLVRTSGADSPDADTPTPEGSSVRLVGDCRHERCAYWSDSCQLAGAIIDESDSTGELPVCSIRKQCRWWLEHGRAACGTCSLVSYTMHLSAEAE